MGESTCSVAGCGKGGKLRRGMCNAHYERLRRTGRVGEAAVRSHRNGCDVAGCGGKHRTRGYCTMHWERWRKHGDPQRVDRGGYAHPRGERNPKWIGGRASYNTVHNRLRRTRGTPSRCEHCGTEEPGIYQWALDWTRVTDVRRWPKERRGRVEMLPYSVDPEDYIRLCIRCHRAFDLKHAWPWERGKEGTVEGG